jgi:hypothetical protein
VNKSGYIQIAFQNQTFALLPYAVGLKSTRFLDALVRDAEYTFAHQHSDGRFDYSESNGTVTTGSVQGPLSEASSATTFFSDFGHSLLVLAKDPWFRDSAECAPFRSRLALLRDKSDASLTWLLAQRDLLRTDNSASNRTITHALSYYFMGRALERRDAMNTGREIFREAIAAQTPDGVFLESHGFDSSYQAVNVLFCEFMYLNLASRDGDLAQPTWDAIRRGVARELPSVEPSGEVSTAGNTRVRANGEVYVGHVKGVNSKQVLAALGYYAVMAGDADALATTRRVYHFYYPGDKVDF